MRDTAVHENTTAVLASTQDIQANTPLDPLIAQGVFHTIQVPNDGVVPNAVKDVSELQGKTATAPIYQNEQIPVARISSGFANTYGIDPGNVGIGLEVQGQAAVNGIVQQGDNITIYATFRRGTLVTKQGLKVLLTPAQINKAFAQALGGAPATGSVSTNVFQVQTDFTIALVPSVEVLSVQNPPVDTTTGRTATGGSTYILNMVPTDAQELIFATDHATLYLGLLPPENPKGYTEPGTIGVPFGKVIGVSS